MAKRRARPTRHFILHDGVAREEPNATAWTQWLEQSVKERQVAVTVSGQARVVTEFTGEEVVPNATPGPPKLYRTQVIGGRGHGMFLAYATRDEAHAGHARMLKLLETYFSNDKPAHVLQSKSP